MNERNETGKGRRRRCKWREANKTDAHLHFERTVLLLPLLNAKTWLFGCWNSYVHRYILEHYPFTFLDRQCSGIVYIYDKEKLFRSPRYEI